MKCPFCKGPESRVIDSRAVEGDYVIRRRRQCSGCLRRFTTYERAEAPPLVVVKKDGRREAYDRKKVLSGLMKACHKRPVPLERLESLVDSIEEELRGVPGGEVHAGDIGERVMASLKDIDGVAYVRFASVYRQFTDATSFIEEIKGLLPRKERVVRGEGVLQCQDGPGEALSEEGGRQGGGDP